LTTVTRPCNNHSDNHNQTNNLKPAIQLPMEGYGRLNMGSRIKYQWRGMEGLIWGLIILIFHDSAYYKSTIQISIKELIWFNHFYFS
jgi:hypothetical protein